MITRVFLSPGHTEVAVELDDGDSGIVVITPESGSVRDVDEISSAWITCYEDGAGS